MPSHDIDRIVREKFGYGELRPGQREAIQSVLDGRDTLAVMPTGSGKSAIHQVASLVISGPTVVVSPLIALQRDQVESIEKRGDQDASRVDSFRRAAEKERTFEELESGELEYLFLSPEQFNSEETLMRLRAARPSLFVVDEAHCISEWGHDFRPDYLRLGTIVEALGHPTVLAMTATASPLVRKEIVERLNMRDPRMVVRGFDRPNIELRVERFADEESKRDALLDLVEKAEKPGIVYVATRKHAEEIAEALPGAFAYHAGMKKARRDEVQGMFMDDEVDVIVCTNAFGMGIDKPNTRFVYHYDITDSVDSYYQEIGRAGRDGAPAKAVLFYRPEDLGLRRFFAGTGQVDQEKVEKVADAVDRKDGPVHPRELSEETDLSQSKLTTALSRLEEVGVVEVLPTGEVAMGERDDDLEAAAEEATHAQEHRKEFEQSRIMMIQGYAEVRDCRREYLLNYFGEEFDPPCGFCDNCEAGIVVDEAEEPFPANSRVVHKKWGEGLVQRYESGKMIVLFDEVGYKTMDIDLVKERGLLEPAGK